MSISLSQRTPCNKPVVPAMPKPNKTGVSKSGTSRAKKSEVVEIITLPANNWSAVITVNQRLSGVLSTLSQVRILLKIPLAVGTLVTGDGTWRAAGQRILKATG